MDDPGSIIFQIVLLFVLILVNAFFAMSEIAIISLNDNMVEKMAEEGNKKAKQIMTGNKWRLFKLYFSFIGWLLLSVVTLGIGALFLTPYMEAATAEFYLEIKNK